jgi:hypothetical protein
MKKLLILICLFVGFTAIATAQTARKKAPAALKLEKVKPTTESNTASKSFKKDGTPDKRFKENKQNRETPAGPLKKDGTPDLRYKKNKAKKG